MKEKRKRKRSYIGAATGIALILLQPVHVSANVICMPENGFFQRHSEECEYLNRVCYADDGTYLWVAPNFALTGKYNTEPEKTVYISFVYTDQADVQWGYADQEKRWILMADLRLKYSNTEFWKEHEQEIYSDVPYILPENESVVLWSYPESGVVIDEDASLPFKKEITSFYQDSSGRTWGNIAYIYGSYDLWVCLSDMKASKLPAREKQELFPAQTLGNGQIKEIKTKGRIVSGLLLAALVSVVLAVIFLGWKFAVCKKKKGN